MTTSVLRCGTRRRVSRTTELGESRRARPVEGVRQLALRGRERTSLTAARSDAEGRWYCRAARTVARSCPMVNGLARNGSPRASPTRYFSMEAGLEARQERHLQ